MKPVSTHDDRGESLIELLVALTIMATAVVALVGAIATSIRTSDLHRRQTVAGGYVKEFAEAIQSRVAQRPSGYAPRDCASDPATTYGNFYDIPMPDRSLYARSVTVKYWDSAQSKFVAGCSGTDHGVQLLSLVVKAKDTSRATVEEKLEITIRQPCRPKNTTPLLDPPATPAEDAPCS
ncbi:hypothetical protein Rhe02_35990 [Rhizocola hellebori]|uniref:Uncharacterized protein n=1 Tax=Rhizocola hellebori TaxID=1392758 RepID=A0A8J3VGU3_9ACTN|nr:prepilin-type N-terminal cleavage/methylation domain-containing protein [Rhizocola hellebori]GIH05532.1 hypothetical protein Rhe02_35990 [Rhizocola hellebori]